MFESLYFKLYPNINCHKFVKKFYIITFEIHNIQIKKNLKRFVAIYALSNIKYISLIVKINRQLAHILSSRMNGF